jgi:hypothetical protein
MRRIIFSAPFVVITSCSPPVEHAHPHRPHRGRQIQQAGPLVDAYRRPDQLVDELKPLSKDKTMEDVCRHALCNPPRPGSRPSPPPPLVPVLEDVTAMKREPTGTRVRIYNGAGIDAKWQAVFVNRDGAPLPDGECTIVAWSYEELECTTALTPEQIAERPDAHQVRITPPPELVAKVERERSSWQDPGCPPAGWPGSDSPRCALSRSMPLVAPILSVQVQGPRTVYTLGLGSKAGIAPGWRAVLVNEHEVPLAGGDCAIIDVTANRTLCTSALTQDQIRKGLMVRLGPPASP